MNAARAFRAFRTVVLWVPAAAAFGLASCAGPAKWEHRPARGKAATWNDGLAYPPHRAPRPVVEAIRAANEIAGSPYVYGGGHGRVHRGGFDCSGSVSHVLSSAGLLRGSMTSSGFRRYGRPGRGEWISVYAARGHVFLEIAGLRYDTGWTGQARGPRWTKKSRPIRKYVVRHPPGL